MSDLSTINRPAVVVLLVLSSLSMLGGCASTPVPHEQMAVAESTVQRANTASTAEMAAMELRVATDKLAAARSALASGDSARARQLAEQAELDAQVAELHAQAARSQRAARESQDAAMALREEINRKAVR